MRRGSAAAAAALVGCMCLVARDARAVSPVLWTVETLEEFERGKPDGTALGATGELTIGPATSALNVPPLEQSAEPFLWCLAADGKGTVYAGGGKSGTIYRVPKGGVGSVYYETGDLAVHALVVDHDALYAATLPQGRIVRVTGEGKGETWYQPEDRYVWDLALGPKGELYAATGERGIIYKITGQGKAEIFFDSEEFHITSLALDAQGNLLAGSDGKGLLYRITPQGKATVLYDAPLREITALAVDAKGAVYAAAIGAESEPPPLPLILPNPVLARETAPPGLPGQPSIQVPGISEEPTPRVTVTTLGGTVAGGTPQAKSEVYRIDADGTVVSVWSSPTEIAYALAIDAAGRPVIGTGEPARVRVLTAARQSVLLAKLPPSQVTALLTSGRQVIAATSNVGRLYLLDPAQAESGSYLSEPQDALTTARWGRIAWRAAVPSGSRVEISTRTGNSATPDATWSDWSQVYATPDGSAITSPAARFLQWRARLQRQGNGEGPTLQAVSVAYLQANLPPQAKRLTLLSPGVVRERSSSPADVDPESLAFTGMRGGPAPAPRADSGTPDVKKVYARGQRAFEWEADDPNGDTLSYDLWFRGEGETAWKPLARGLREPYFAFDSMSLPDGLYRVRLDVSDAPGNAADQAKIVSLQSETFLVDNTAPVVQVTARKGGKGPATTLEITATDGFGPLSRAEASLDAARWTPLSPVDGVGDSRNESYTLALEGLRPGEHTAIVRVFDLLGNVGSGKATFTTE